MLRKLAFDLSDAEKRFLSPQWSDDRAKNISLEGDSLKGARGAPQDLASLAAMIARFAASAAELVSGLFPRYAPYVKTARTSFRPQPAAGRALSWRKDDALLHIDAFPSRPNHGERILRVFCNVNPSEDRVWRVASHRPSRDQGPPQRVRSSDARAARLRQSGSRLPAQLSAAGAAFLSWNDMAVLLRSSDARGCIRAIHARADHSSADRRTLSSRQFAARHSGEALRAIADATLSEADVRTAVVTPGTIRLLVQ